MQGGVSLLVFFFLVWGEDGPQSSRRGIPVRVERSAKTKKKIFIFIFLLVVAWLVFSVVFLLAYLLLGLVS